MPDISIQEINEKIKKSPAAFILEAEGEYKRKIEELAEKIVCGGKIRVVFISGPSSSGKTTTTNLLADKINALDVRCMVLSLDDFYLDHGAEGYPTNEDGTLDLESVNALDLPFLAKTLKQICGGEEFEIPKYEFELSRRTEINKYPPIDKGVVIIEGLHALNPLVFGGVDDSKSLKVFISVSTNIVSDGVRIISGRKLRFVRRMVRDSLYRATPPEATLSRWESVISGEDKYLYPTRKYADVDFNTFHPFELSLMRPFVEALVTEPLIRDSFLIRVVVDAVRAAEPLDISLVPEDSLMKEFVPGGIYEHLY